LLGLVLHHIPPTFVSQVAKITYVCHHNLSFRDVFAYLSDIYFISISLENTQYSAKIPLITPIKILLITLLLRLFQ
jgi:hypothetical protein